MALVACGGVDVIPRASAPEAPTQGLSKCSVAASRSNPLVTEWPASEKANLEVRLREGAVAVAYSGCDMRLVPACRLGGGYQWLRTSVANDVIEIRTEDDLYAKLPLGALSLEGELRSSGRLSMQVTVTGQVRLVGVALDAVRATPECSQATHVLSSMSIGAFKLRSGGALKAAGGISAPVGEAGVGTESSERLLREAGRPDVCGSSTDQAPHVDCRSPIQMFLTPLPWAKAPPVRPGHKRVSFVSGQGQVPWEVYAGGSPLCTTPCTREVPEGSAFTMKIPEASLASFWPEVDIPRLSDHTPSPQVEVRAYPSSNALVLTGITFTALSGMAVVAGIPLTAVGFGIDDTKLRNAGLITGSIGIAALAGSIYLIAVGRSYPEIREQGWLTVGPDGAGLRF
ncbi:MAG: hypothetical protein JRI23_04755 [Deltaproteobacteria bacterium]|jgi:hypothetical protein|nr:hypothetical protein [Deltaproteobacteria bacterium]MBW2530859.1 hypothetical protein [Deltaproteobacteria bacterium]